MPATTLSRKLHLAICAFSLSSSIGDSFLKGGGGGGKTHSPTAAMHHTATASARFTSNTHRTSPPPIQQPHEKYESVPQIPNPRKP